MPSKVRKYFKLLTIFLSGAVLIIVGAFLIANYYLKQSGITYESFNYEYPNEITFNKLRFENESFLLTSDHTYLNLRLRTLFRGRISARFLEAENMWIELKPADPNDATTFELSELMPIQLDRVVGTNIHYKSKEGLDSMVIDLPSLYAINFVIEDGIFMDSIISRSGTLVASFYDTIEADTTTPLFADLIYLNANSFELKNAHMLFNYTDQSYDAKQVNISLNGWGTDNPLDFRLNQFSILYADSIELSSNGEKLFITQKGDLGLEDFSFKTTLFDLSISQAGTTTQNRYYATLKQSQISSNLVRMVMDDFPVAQNVNMMYDGGIIWDNDSIIFDHFEINLDHGTKAVVNGYAIYSDSLEKANIEIVTFQSSLFELQRMFSLDEIEDQQDVEIESYLRLTGNLSELKVLGNAQLNKSMMNFDLMFVEKPLGRSKLRLDLNSDILSPHQFLTASPEDLTFRKVMLNAEATVDSSFNIMDLTTSFNCSQLISSDYQLTDLTADVSISSGLTKLNVRVNEQNFALNIQTKNNVIEADSVHFTGLLNLDVPSIADLSTIAGIARTPFDGYLKNTDSELIFGIILDSLHFSPGNLENEYVNKVTFSYRSDTTDGVAIDLNIDNEDILHFEGDEEIFKWISAVEIDTSNYPYFEAELHHIAVDSTLLTLFLGEPGSVNISNLTVKSTENSIAIALYSPLMVYNEYRLENTTLNFSTNFKIYNGDLAIDSLENKYANLNDVKVKIVSTEKHNTEGQLYVMLADLNESIEVSIQIIDAPDTKMLKFKDGRNIKVGAQEWVVTENQGASFDSDWKLQKSHFTLSSGSQSIGLSTRSEIIDLEISKLQIEPIYSVLTGDTLVSGSFNLQSEYQVDKEYLSWKGSLDSISIDTISIGNLSTRGHLTATQFESHQELIHQNSELLIDLNKRDNGAFEYDLNLKKFDVASLNPIYQQLRFDGEINGALEGRLQGALDDEITAEGYLYFNNVILQINEYGMYAAIPDSKIFIEDELLSFNEFLVKDRDGKTLSINGTIPIRDGKPLQLIAKTEQFKLLEQDNRNKKYWGKIDISSEVKLSGTSDNLTVTGYLDILNSSNVGYRYENEIKVNKLEDEIEFVSFSDTLSHEIAKNKVSKENKLNWDFDVNLDNTKLYVLLTELTNDYAKLTANGQLKLRTGQGLAPNLYGKIESKSGSIFYAVPMVSDLDLKINYASVQFEGNLENPIISFTGTEVFRVSTKEISGSGNKKRQLVPVEVIAIVKERPLEEFELMFDLRSDDGQMGSFIDGLPTNTRQTYAMNLLIFGSMKGSSDEGNSTMKAVVAKLNEISRRNLQSAELAFYMDTENNGDANNSQGINTIGYDFSKSLFQDKVSVSVGGEVVLEGNVADGRKQFNLFSNVEVKYQLIEDPNIEAFASRADSYLGPVDGQVDQYSFGFSFTKWFKNIFHKKKKKDE